ncbi:MAG: hypothetical protein O3A00_12060 [Planctomycetota bacterium]|nr:hypothetical protein [Planctomycetota bacterium]
MSNNLFRKSIASLALASAGLSMLPVDVDAGIFDRLLRKRSRPAAEPTHSPTFGYHATHWRRWPGCELDGQLPPGAMFHPLPDSNLHMPTPLGTQAEIILPPPLVMPYEDAPPALGPPGYSTEFPSTRPDYRVRDSDGRSSEQNVIPIPPQPGDTRDELPDVPPPVELDVPTNSPNVSPVPTTPVPQLPTNVRETSYRFSLGIPEPRQR